MILVPLALLMLVSGVVFGLAEAQPFKKGTGADQPVVLGDAAHGRVVFGANCATCHGADAQGAFGPALRGNPIPIAEARGVIRAGRGAMPSGLVTGSDEADVLAYLVTLGATP